MKLQQKDLRRLLAARPAELRAILVYGADAGQIGETADLIARSVVEDLADPFGIDDLPADTILQNPSSFFDAIMALSLLGGARLVRVRAATDRLTTTLQGLASFERIEALVVVEAGELAAQSKLRQLFERSPVYAALACYRDEGPALASFIRTTLKERSVGINPGALEFLLARLGADRRQTRSELEKLALFVGPNQTVTLDSAAVSIGDSGFFAVEDIANSAADGDPATLDRALTRAFSDGENSVRILRGVIMHFQRLHRVAVLVSTGEPVDTAIKRLRPPVFWKRAAQFKAQTHHWPVKRIEQCLGRLFEAEAQCKSTGIPDQTACAQILLGISLSGRAAAGSGRRARR